MILGGLLLWGLAGLVYRKVRHLFHFKPHLSDDATPEEFEAATKQAKQGCLPFVAIYVAIIAAFALRGQIDGGLALIIAVPPSLFLVLVLVGWIYWRMSYGYILRMQAGDAMGVEREVRDEIETKGPNAKRLCQLALILLSDKRWQEALSTLEQAKELGPLDNYSRANWALALWKVGRIDEASAAFEEIMQDLDGDVVINSNYCQFLAERGQWDEARQRFARAEKEFADGRGMRSKDAELIQGELERCRRLFEDRPVAGQSSAED